MWAGMHAAHLNSMHPTSQRDTEGTIVPYECLRVTGLWKQEWTLSVQFKTRSQNIVHVPGQCPYIETDGICTKTVTTELESGVLTKWCFYHLENKTTTAEEKLQLPLPGAEVRTFSLTTGGFGDQTPSLLTDRIIGILSTTQYPYLASFHVTQLPGEIRNRERKEHILVEAGMSSLLLALLSPAPGAQRGSVL